MLRRSLLALALGALATVGAPLARAEDPPSQGASLTIAPSDGGASKPLALADLAARFDVHGVRYTLRAADGATSSVTVADGISLAELLTAAGLAADPYTYIEIARADGTSTLLLADDLGGTDEGPPVVWADDQGVHFLRPSDGRRDVNAGDLLTVSGAAIAIELRTGEPLAPRIAASALRARPGQRIDFGASLAAGTLGQGMDFQWYFDGSGTVLGQNVSHRFPRAGTYVVLLNVVRGDAGEAIGSPDTVHVRVVSPRRDERPRGAHGSDEASDGDGGGGNGTGGGGSAGGIGVAPQPSSAQSPAPAAPDAARPAPASTPSPRRAPVPPAEPRGALVSGTLIAPASSAAAPPSGAPAARVVALGAASDGPLHVPVGAWVAIGIVALLALGWALESRHTLPFWQP